MTNPYEFLNEPPNQARFRTYEDAQEFCVTGNPALKIDPAKEPQAYRKAPFARHFVFSSQIVTR